MTQMKVTGYKLLHAMREAINTRDIASEQFKKSLMVFKGDEREDPKKLMDIFWEAERRISAIQTAQMRYNLDIVVNVLGTGMALAEVIKSVGAAGRREKMWRSCAKGTDRDRYGYREDTRNKDEEKAMRTVSVEDAIALAKDASKYAAALREAIAVGNSTEIEVENLTPDLFE